MPDIFYDTLDVVPADLREYAKESDGKVVVSVVPKVKLDEFRNNNIAISQERDTLKGAVTRFVSILGTEDLDAVENEVKELRTVGQKVKDGKLVADTSLEEAIAQRTKTMRDSYEENSRRTAAETAAWKDKAGSLDLELRRGEISRAVTAAALDEQLGVHASAIPDILQRAFGVYTVTDDRKLVPKRGEAVIYGEDGTTPMPPKEWLKELRNEAPHFFKGSTGGGAQGGQGGTRYGMTDKEFAALPAEKRLALANGEKPTR